MQISRSHKSSQPSLRHLRSQAFQPRETADAMGELLGIQVPPLSTCRSIPSPGCSLSKAQLSRAPSAELTARHAALHHGPPDPTSARKAPPQILPLESYTPEAMRSAPLCKPLQVACLGAARSDRLLTLPSRDETHEVRKYGGS